LSSLKRLLQNQSGGLLAPLTKAKALQRILNWKTGIGFNFVRTRRTAAELTNCNPLVTVPMNTTVT